MYVPSVEEEGFSIEVEGRRVRGLVMAVATGEEVARAADSGAEFMATSVFTQDAAEAAKRRGAQLMSLEDLVDPLSILAVRLMLERRGDPLFRLFDVSTPCSFSRDHVEHLPVFRGVEAATRGPSVGYGAPLGTFRSVRGSFQARGWASSRGRPQSPPLASPTRTGAGAPEW